MAKKVIAQSAATWVNVAKVYWKATRNCRSKPSTRREGLTLQLVDGWNQVNGSVPVESITTINELEGVNLVDECLAERQAQWDALKASTSPEDTIKLEVFKSLYTANDKLIRPEYVANACFQRGAVYFASQVERFKQAQVDEEILPKVITDIPIVIRTYKDQAERRAEQVWENESRDSTSESLSDQDRLTSAKELYDLCYNEAKFRKTFKDGMGQKLFAIMRLDSMYPAVKILPRLQLPEGTPSPTPEGLARIPFGPLNPQEMGRLIRRTNPELVKANETIVTEIDIIEYFGGVRGKKNAAKIMSKDDIKTISVQSPVAIVKDVAKSILNNDKDALKPYTDMSQGFNLLGELRKLGAYPEAVKRLTALFDETLASRPSVLDEPQHQATLAALDAEESVEEEEEEGEPDSVLYPESNGAIPEYQLH